MRLSHVASSAFAALLTLSAVPASAADLPYEAAPASVMLEGFSWTGAYVGGAVGYAFSDLKSRNGNVLRGDTFSTRDKVDSVIGSAFVGYNYQFGSIVAGAEADLTLGDFGGKTKGSCPDAGAFSFSCKTNADDLFGTVRGRVGYAFERFLVFATGGLAIGGDVDFKRNAPVGFPIAGADFAKKDSGVRYGYTLGGGVDYAVTDNIILRGEYQYVDFGTESFTVRNGIGNDQAVKIKQDANIIRVGVAYKF